MSFKKLYIYLISFICGIALNNSKIYFLIPLLLNLYYVQCAWILIISFIFIGFGWYKILFKGVINFAVATGCIEYKTSDKLYINTNGKNVPSCLILNYKSQEKSIKEGDKIKFSCVYYPTNYGKINQIYYVQSKDKNVIQKFRDKIKQIFEKSKFKSFIYAITIGDRSFFNISEINLFKNNGFWHLLSISGLHINIIMFSFYRILRKLLSLNFWLNYNFNIHNIASIISIIIGWIYIKISLFPIPAIRAFCMTATAILFSGRLDSRKVLLLLAGSMIILDPHLVFNMGFQLSFICTLILLNNFSLFFLNLAVLPILNQFNLLTLFTNFIILPLFSLILILCIVNIFLNSFWLIKVLDILIFLIFKVMNFYPIIINVKFNQVSLLIYLIILNFSILSQKQFLLKGMFIFIFSISLITPYIMI